MLSARKAFESPFLYLAILLVVGVSYLLTESLVVMFLAYFLIGFPHGALDIVKIKTSKKAPLLFVSYLLLGFVFAFFLVEQTSISLSFLFFISFLHFLHVEWSVLKKGCVGYVDLAFASLFILPNYFNLEFRLVLQQLGAPEFYQLFHVGWGSLVPIYLSFFFTMLYMNRKKLYEYFLGVAAFWSLGLSTDLYFAFSVYFIAIHSMRHMQAPFQNSQLELSRPVIFFLLMSSALFSAPILIFPDKLYILFIILGALSLPHLCLEIRPFIVDD